MSFVNSNSGSILGADDEENDRFILNMACRRAKLSCALVTVADGRECVDYLNGVGGFADRTLHPLPELLILDLKMPRMDGFEVLAWLATRPDFKNMPVVVLSSSSADSDIRKARQLGAIEYFVKPNALAELVKIVQSIQSRWLLESRVGTKEQSTPEVATVRFPTH